MEVGNNPPRVDVLEKVLGRARYVEDYMPRGAYVARVLHSKIASGVVKSIDVQEALKIKGVLKIVTCFDVPDIQYATAASPWNPDPHHRAVADRKILNTKVRFFGDDIAAVVALDEVAADRALRALRVEYEECRPVLWAKDAMADGAPVIHEEHPDNIVKHTSFGYGEHEAALANEKLSFYEGTYRMPSALHGHIEPASSGAYMENGRIVIVTGTQTIFSVQRQVAAALGMPWGMVRVIKPYIGGSFGNRQDVLYEALAAYLTTLVGGHPVWVKLTQEETMNSTRSRHDIEVELKSGVDSDGRLVTREIKAYANQGGYASQGHGIVSSAVNAARQLYPPSESVKAAAWTVYTNAIVAGAMRGYGSFQGIFAVECHMEDIARARSVDPCDFRLKNILPEGFVDPVSKVTFWSIKLADCVKKGREVFDWDLKRKRYENQTGLIRRGVGVAFCCYKTGAFPMVAEIAAARMHLGQDGLITLYSGAVDVGQGTETVLSQIAADAVGVPLSRVRLNPVQDTDMSPYDHGAFASRQTYMAGSAVKETGKQLREKILACAGEALNRSPSGLDLVSGYVVEKGGSEKLLDMNEVAQYSIFGKKTKEQLTAECTFNCHENPLSTAACFAEIEVDIALGKIKVLDVINVHDSGTVIHPKTAESQVHGGMGMSLGCATLEEVIYDENGILLNNNMLDYKIPSSVDLPELKALFVESYEPTGPDGAKSLAEVPIMIPVIAVRNALLQATGVAFNDLPMSPQRLVERFYETGILGGEQHV